jgi:glycosyltransferase involved in cell wall biosynthesis
MKGLRENGVEIIECRDNSRGPLKFVKLFIKHWKIRNDYDVMIVGYPSHIAVPLAKFISNKKVVLDALCTMWESETFSHKASNFKQIEMRIIDWLAVKFADIILVETFAQKKFFEKRFGGNPVKYKVVYTGADNSIFFKDFSVPKLQKFSVLFKGRLTPEAGVKYVLKAADILKNQNIFFRIIGFGILKEDVEKQISDLELKNVELICNELPFDELRKNMLECHLSLGQFENNPRLSRTIPHKCFETLALGLPYVTSRAPAISERLKDGKNCLFVNPADPKDLVEKILMLKNNQNLARAIGNNGYNLYQKKFNPKNLAKDILAILQNS